MIKTRDEYLQKYWNAYPECPRGFLQYGRVHQLRLGVSQLADFKARDAQDFTGRDILLDGDLIALMPAGQFVLLAPNLTNRPGFYKAEEHPWTLKKSYYEYLQLLRNFFVEKRFLEATTPTLVDCPGTEPSLNPFVTELVIGSNRKKFYLPTSPELHLKKLLSMGAEKIFEIAHVFRNGEKTEKHHPEFLMLEWYRSMSYLANIKHDAIELVEYLCDNLKVEKPKEVLTFSVADLFKTYCGFELKPDTTAEQLKNLALQLGVDVASAETIDDYFYLIFMDKIEYRWPADRLVFIEKYPPYQAALARIDKDGWAERFEIYWKGLELANAFHELNNPQIQRQRSLDDLDKKQKAGQELVGLDEQFFQALEYGMPPSAGIALGIERLYMALRNVKSIDSLVEFSNSRVLCGK
ncbi:MAG: EF-P lysine aminoacylase EpmA [Pseudobdellovibrio sp.]